MKATMRTGVVVVVGPRSEADVFLLRVGPVSGIRPFAQSGVDEAFGVAEHVYENALDFGWRSGLPLH